ncbi:MAG: NUDIX domain-containing protein [Candidatus Latescibacteria bacterium]|nr:NUDIX domain-containing protein [Candidatus Latescibacterota bacterium]
MPTIVSILFVNPDGEILVHHRDNDPRILFPDQWSIIGGHVEDGETPEQALIREVREEIGHDLTQFEHLATFYDADHTRHFYVAPLDKPVSALVLGEGQGLRFIDPRRALDELDVCLTGRRYIEAYLCHLAYLEYLKHRANDER